MKTTTTLKKDLIKDVEYNNDLFGFILTLKNDKIVQIQFTLETNRLHADYNTHYAHIDRQNDYGLDITEDEESVINDFIRYSAEIQNKCIEFDEMINN